MRWLVHSLLLLLICLPGLASVPATLFFQNLAKQERGINLPSVVALLQDRQGFVWMGTQSGLARFDGYRSIVYTHDPAQPGSLPDQNVFALHEDAQGRLWVGTRSGLMRYVPETDRFTPLFPPSASAEVGRSASRFIRHIVSDGGRGLWLATQGGLQHVDTDTGRFQVFRHDPQQAGSLASNQVMALARDAGGGLWVGTDRGLDYLAPGSAAFVHHRASADQPARAQADYVRALLLDGSNTLWIGSGAGVTQWSPASPWAQRRSLDPPGGGFTDVSAIRQDADGDLWFGADSGGLLRLNRSSRTLTRYRHQPGDDHSLASDRAVSLLQDRSGALWVGTWDKGVSRVDLASGGFERFVPRPGDPGSLPEAAISGLEVQKDGSLWVSSLKGLTRFDPKTGQVLANYRHRPEDPGSLSSDFLLSLLQTDDALWVGAKSGLNRLDLRSGRFTRMHFERGSPSDTIVRIIRGEQGRLWLATTHGLIRYDPRSGAWRKYVHAPDRPDSLGNNYVTRLLRDSAGTLWVGTYQGLNRLDDEEAGRFTQFRHDPKVADSLGNDVVVTLFEDRAGRLWVGTAHGVYRAQPQADGGVSFRSFPLKDGNEKGFDNNQIGDIRQDAAGQLWISSAAGLSRLDPESGNSQSYSTRDGLTENFVVGCSAQSPDGTLYFGGFGGVTAFQPARLRSNQVVPQVAITDVSVLNRSLRGMPASATVALAGALPNPQGLTLSWREPMLTLEFSALHYADPGRNRYRYQLVGFDQNWIDTDADHRIATYTNLDPGDYVFRVTAANKDGIWNTDGASMTITVTPPYWHTWWFRLLATAAILASALLLYFWRVRTLMAQQARLAQLVAERTRELQVQKEALHRANLALEEASLTDPLTGLHNRRFLFQRMENDMLLALRRAKARPAPERDAADVDMVFFIVDLDHFKAVNDQYGHACGDLVLLQLRQRLQEVFRETDYLVRWGGEEFVAVARNTSQSQASSLAERVRLAVAQHPFELTEGRPLRQTCSIGFACFPFYRQQPELLSWSQIIDLADQALYMAKRGGRNAWVGLYGGQLAVPVEDFDFQRLREHPQRAIDNGEIRRVTCLASWPQPDLRFTQTLRGVSGH